MGIFWFLVFALSLTVQRATAATTTKILSDALSLLSFKAAISRDSFDLLSNWNSTVDHCLWYGVTCHRYSGRVRSLNITFPHAGEQQPALTGILPQSIGNLTKLRTLSLPHNAFSGEIPPSIGLLQSLKVLELQGNNFSGEIPYQISYMKSLRVLNLSCNSLSGSVPGKLIGNGELRVVDLSNNMLSGGISMDNRSSCNVLSKLKLSFNFLIGSIPSAIGRCKNLRSLLLDSNILQGRLPGEIGGISELRVLDVSRNSLTDRIPGELANCSKLSVVVLTNVVDESKMDDSSRLEFNAFDGGLPHDLLLLPSLQVFWAPRANLGGRLPYNWTNSCSLKVLNLGQNYFDGVVPVNMGTCKKLTFLDLSSNNLLGYLPLEVQVPCMVYFNVSQNNITGLLPVFEKTNCDRNTISYGQSFSFLDFNNIEFAYANVLVLNSLSGSMFDDKSVIIHDFSWNRFTGSFPLFLLGDEFLRNSYKLSYRLLLNDNSFDGSLEGVMDFNCTGFPSFSVNLTSNQISGGVHEVMPLGCRKLTEFEAAFNQISGSVSSDIGNLVMLQRLDLRGNKLSGSLPIELGKMKKLQWVFLGGNSLTGEIPSQIGELTSLEFLDLSYNALTGNIPSSLTNATHIESLKLDHNKFYGEIPSSFSALSNLSVLDVSFNNLSGHIPYLQQHGKCDYFRGNIYLDPCSDQSSPGLPIPLDVHKQQHRRKLKYVVIAVVTAVSVALCIFLVIFLIKKFGRKKFDRLDRFGGKVVMTFADAPGELNYDNVVRATGNFSIDNLIGTGGFGSTYKAELVPGYLVAVKRLSIGRFQGIQQFDAEITTLGRIRHKNLVTLVGYYFGKAEMFLIYNYLSGGNLESFIHNNSGKYPSWLVIHNIALDIAQALAYLHYSCVPRIVHRDIKPSNILLDEDLNAYLSDFGLARLLEVSETHATTDVAGTFGYVAPEYATTCRVSDKADVYSFGVVLLELMSGKKTLDPSFSEYRNGFNIVAWATLLINEGRSSELFSPELWEAGPRDNLLEMLRLASNCTEETLSVRPSMKQVLEKLKQLRL